MNEWAYMHYMFNHSWVVEVLLALPGVSVYHGTQRCDRGIT